MAANMAVEKTPAERYASVKVQKPSASKQPVPASALWLGALGAVPFVALAIAGFFGDAAFRQAVATAQVYYGAVILTFLGGIQWGLAISGASPQDTDTVDTQRLFIGILPALIGWGALLLPYPATMIVLILGFLALLIYDYSAAKRRTGIRGCAVR